MLTSSKDANHPTFTLQTRNPLASKASPISISSFAVYMKVDGKWDYANALWEIKADRDTSLDVKTITYGVTPKGFKTSVAARPLVQGREYQGVGFGGNANGSVAFTR